MVDLLCGGTANRLAAMQENLQQADDAGVVDFDSGITDRADGNRQSDALEQGKVHMYVQALRLKTGKAVRNSLKLLAYGIEVIESLPQAEIIQIVG